MTKAWITTKEIPSRLFEVARVPSAIARPTFCERRSDARRPVQIASMAAAVHFWLSFLFLIEFPKKRLLSDNSQTQTGKVVNHKTRGIVNPLGEFSYQKKCMMLLKMLHTHMFE